MATLRETRATLAADVWSLFLVFFKGHRERVQQLLEDLGLSFGDMRALLALDAGEPRPMGVLATAWACDASNATWMVDRLEQRGLVERRSLPGDRRVKAVVLTEQGVAAKADLVTRLHEPPADVISLSRAELLALREALTKLVPPGGRPSDRP
ncbi:MAG: MarR family winged helix-turn-helix transcriptional regulator [Acidimicrobiales bacterium]